MASCPDLKVTITVDVVERGRATSVGKWAEQFECATCGHIDCMAGGKRYVCRECGNRGALNPVVARWVVRKVGFWFWQTTGRFEKKAA
jgi:predicted RNA-binding Zn-ribbon protein involved in translation (DUF1610 family)